jgi:hypothetical protein
MFDLFNLEMRLFGKDWIFIKQVLDVFKVFDFAKSVHPDVELSKLLDNAFNLD